MAISPQEFIGLQEPWKPWPAECAKILVDFLNFLSAIPENPIIIPLMVGECTRFSAKLMDVNGCEWMLMNI